jgi:hypothetical protein
MSPSKDGWFTLRLPDLDSAQVIISDAGANQGPACLVRGELWVEEGQWPGAHSDHTEAYQPGQAGKQVMQDPNTMS